MDNDQSLWIEISSSYKQLLLALQDFLSEGFDRIGLIKPRLRGKDRNTAIFLLTYLSENELIQLFDDLIFLSSFSHRSIKIIRDIIASLPRTWVLSEIEKTAEPILSEGDYGEFRRFLELYIELDYSLTLRLAKRAKQNDDPDIKEAGEDFLQILSNLGFKENGVV